jgi:hypothetical protein
VDPISARALAYRGCGELAEAPLFSPTVQNAMAPTDVRLPRRGSRICRRDHLLELGIGRWKPIFRCVLIMLRRNHIRQGVVPLLLGAAFSSAHRALRFSLAVRS